MRSCREARIGRVRDNPVLLAAPGTVAGLVPWLLSRWRLLPALLGLPPLRYLGALLILAGLLVLLESFARFALLGRGTPAPVLPTERLVVTGLYRHVRNPMYVAVVSLVAGQGLLLANTPLLAYAVLLWMAFHAFVLAYEEPTLARRHGLDYAAFQAAVPRWFPRLRPWNSQAPADLARAGAREGPPFRAAGLVVLAAALLAQALLGPPFFHNNDDPVMSTIVAGVGWIAGESHPSERAVFVHLFVGRALAALYGWDPSVPWYGLLLLGAVALAAFWSGYAGLRLDPPPLARTLLVLFTALLLWLGSAHLHFGVSASLLAGGALLLALSVAVRPPDARWQTWSLLAAAFGSALLAALLRPESCWLGLLTLTPLAAMVLLRRGRHLLRAVAGGLGLLAGLHAALLLYEQRDYAATPGWSETFDCIAAKRSLLDHAEIVYDERSQPAFAEAGWSANDFQMLRAWFAWDPQLYSAASLARLHASLQRHGVVVPASLDRGRLRRALVTPLSAAALALALALGFTGSRREAAELALGVLLAAALLLAVALALRAPPLRVHLPVWLLALGAPVWWACLRTRLLTDGSLAPRTSRAAAWIGFLALAAVAWQQGLETRGLARQREQQAAAARRDLVRLERFRGGLLLNWAGLFPVHDLLRPLEPFSSRAGQLGSYGSHSFFWIGWPGRLPINQLWLERHGVRDLYEALYRRDDVLVLARPEYMGLLERYLLEHRGVSVGHELLLGGEAISAFRLVELR